MRPRLAFGLASVLALAACSPSGIDMNDAANPSPAPEPASPGYKVNPAPKQALRITMTIRDAPGPFEWMRPIAHYDVVNRECLSPPKDNPGGRSAPVPTRPTDFKLERTADGVYTGVVYADLMLDEDYTGNGVCHWELTSIVVQMKATGAKGETLFTPAIPGRKLAPGEVETVYYNKNSYPGDRDGERSEYEFANPGLSDRSRFGPSIQDSDLFIVTLALEDGASP